MAQIISSGVSSGSIIIEYDTLIVEDGGQVGTVEIGEGGILLISSGGKVSSATASGLYTEVTVQNGGKLTNANIGTGCWATINAGGSVTSLVEDGGWVDVLNGAEVTFVPHEIALLVVGADQFATIHPETTVNSAFVTGTKYYGGILEVCTGATLSHITVTSNGQLDAHGYISDVTAQEGGYVNAVTTTMENVHLLSGGYGAVYSRGSGSDVTIHNGGSCNVNGGSAKLVMVSSGGSFMVQNCEDDAGSAYQGVAVSTTVRSGGVMRLASGGSADHTNVDRGGKLYLLSGCSATNVAAEAGGNVLFDVVSDTYIDGTYNGSHFLMQNATLSFFTVESQTLNVSNGGTIISNTIGSGGSAYVGSGGRADDTFVTEQGWIYVDAGGAGARMNIRRGGFFGVLLNEYTNVGGTSAGVAFQVEGGRLSNFNLENGQFDIVDGGYAISTTVTGNGALNIGKSGLASAITVSAGGQMTITRGGTVIGVTVGNEGIFTVSSGGTVTGRMTFEPGANVTMEKDSVLDFDLTRTMAGTTALVNDLSIIQGSPLFTITVSETEEDGRYKLAKGAQFFNSTITVRNTSGATLGKIQTGETLSTGNADYTLLLTDDELVLRVVSTSGGPTGDVLLPHAMPQAEYMYGCAPTAMAMLLGYYDKYDYRGYSFSNLIQGEVEILSRGTDGNIYNMSAFDTVLGAATASKDYVYRFYSQGDIDVITGKKPGSYTTNTPAQELEYSFTNGGAGPDLRTDNWNCIADYLGTGQAWRGNEDLSTRYTICTLEQDLNSHGTITYIDGDVQRTIDKRYTSMLYGLYLYVQDRGYSLDLEITGTYKVDTAGGDFTFEDYMAEIKAGRPVLISIEGHAMVGYGYNAQTREIIFDDCYQADQRMVWGGTYHYADADRALQEITVIGLAVETNVDLAVAPVKGAATDLVLSVAQDSLVTETWSYYGSPVYLSFAVSNLGTSPSGEFDVSLFIDGTRLSKLSPFALDSGDSSQQTNHLLPELSIGLHTVKVVVDEDNLIAETSGSNNSAEQKLMVLKAGTNVITTNTQVKAGTVSRDDYVASGWELQVLGGGTAEGTIIQGIVTDINGNAVSYSPGIVTVFEGGLVRNADVYEYGRLNLSGAGETVHVLELGEATVGPTGTLSGITVDANGTLGVASGGKATGRIKLAQDADVTFASGSVLDFDLTLTTAGAAALVNDLSLVKGAPDFTLTVAGTEADGTYNLADGAAGFDKAITVKDTSGAELGTLSVGGTLSLGSVDYRLNLSGSSLNLTVEASAVSVFNTKSDINGNGVSDVMFVWTKMYDPVTQTYSEGNYMHGYWLDGANNWYAVGGSHPAEWENLGCHDMTGDGKADSVLVGNVILESGSPGAYIGYYADGNDLIDGSTWVTIGLLDNGPGNTWKNCVGNLTGSDTAKCIVWYAPELYVVGAWLDSTDHWVSLSGNFGGDAWKLVGCGDFDGDGKESIVMSGYDGAYIYSLDFEGPETSMGATNWSGWEVRAIGDFAGDGKDDLVLFNQVYGLMAMAYDGNLDDFDIIGQLDAQDWFVVGAGDYNGDAKDDLLVRQYSTGMLGYYTCGDTSQWNVLGYGVGMEWTVIA